MGSIRGLLTSSSALVLGFTLLSGGAAFAADTCQQIKVQDPSAKDGEYVLYIGNDPSKPWTAYCWDMERRPTEYLTLQKTGSGSNFAQYIAGGSSPGSTVTTVYTKIRIDPFTLRVDTADQTFSTSTGSLSHGGQPVTAMTYGSGMSCNWAPGGANIDLTGTPFEVAPDQFVTKGWYPNGSNQYSSSNQVVDITGGGNCGWTGPLAADNPFNQRGSFQIDLRYKTTP